MSSDIWSRREKRVVSRYFAWADSVISSVCWWTSLKPYRFSFNWLSLLLCWQLFFCLFVFFGSLSCCVMKFLLFTGIAWLIKIRELVTGADMRAQVMTPPPPCLTDDTVCFGIMSRSVLSPHLCLSITFVQVNLGFLSVCCLCTSAFRVCF